MSVDSVQIATTINYAKSSLKAINGMTFLLNNNWTINDSSNSNPTLPVCFFDVLSMQEICDSDITTKKMIMFNSGKDKDSQLPVIETIADNIKPNPKKYNMEILVPFGDNFSSVIKTMSAKASFMAGYNSNFISSEIENVFSTISSATNIFGNALLALAETLFTTIIQKDIIDFSYVTRSPSFNKTSLEAMWKNRSILKLKSWEDWEYKNVSIVNYTISKKGTEDDYYRATLVLQEMPILTVVPDSISLHKKPNKSDLTSVLVGNKLQTLFSALDTGE